MTNSPHNNPELDHDEDAPRKDKLVERGLVPPTQVEQLTDWPDGNDPTPDGSN